MGKSAKLNGCPERQSFDVNCKIRGPSLTAREWERGREGGGVGDGAGFGTLSMSRFGVCDRGAHFKSLTVC